MPRTVTDKTDARSSWIFLERVVENSKNRSIRYRPVRPRIVASFHSSSTHCVLSALLRGARAAMNVAERLRLEENPFAATSGGVGPPLRTALREVTREIALETPIVVLVGRAGTGKTVLMNMAARGWNNMGLTVRQVDRGDLVQCALDQRSDLLLIDEANSISDSLLRALVSAGRNYVATTMVFSCLPGSVGRFTFSAGRAAVVELAPLSRLDARHYLLEQSTRAGRPDPFMPEALELVVEGSGGSPRLLQSIASLAYFSAAFDGASQIRPKHVLLYLQKKHRTEQRPQWRPLMTHYPRAASGKVPSRAFWSA